MSKKKIGVLFLSVFFLVFLWAAIEARSFPSQAQHFPFYISLLACLATGTECLRMFVRDRSDEIGEPFHDNITRVLRYVCWIVGYVLIIYVIGFVLASMIYLFLFLYIEAKMNIIKSTLTTAIAVAFILVISEYMALKWPSSLITLF